MPDWAETDPLGVDFDTLRRQLFAIAYRMLGTVAEAEDIVQDAFLRLHRAEEEGTVVESRKAYLTTITTRLAIDHLRSARVRRESYVGPWLPEPIVEEREPDAVRQLEMTDSLSMAFLLLLETLSPVERAVFLLREVFDYDYPDIARIVEKGEDNCRQIFARAKKHIDAGKPRFEASRQKRDELAHRFFAACQRADLDALVRVLAADATFQGDGGGKATAVLRPVLGRDRVARLLHGIFSRGRELDPDFHLRMVDVNGQPGAIFFDGLDRIVNVMTLDIVDDAVMAVRTIVNPDKLERLGPTSDLTKLPSRS